VSKDVLAQTQENAIHILKESEENHVRPCESKHLRQRKRYPLLHRADAGQEPEMVMPLIQ
jgi:hypothetical protein